MNPRDPNVAKVELIAQALGPLCEELVFVGGCAVGLLMTDPGAGSPRITFDVDLVVEVASLAGYHRIESELERLAFVRDHSKGAPICRWQFGGVAVDLMPSEERILGFANRWYPRMMQEADRVVLPGGKVIRLVSAPLFVASKFEAFADRGAGDLLGSHDLEDIMTLVAGRPELAGEAALADEELRGYLAQRCAELLDAPGFMNLLPGMVLHDDTLDARVAVVAERLQRLASQT